MAHECLFLEEKGYQKARGSKPKENGLSVISDIAWNKWFEPKSLFLTKNASILRVSQSKVHKVLIVTSSGDTRH